MSKGLESWKYLCSNGFIIIPIPQGNETDKELDDYAIGCGYDIEKSLKALEIIKNIEPLFLSVTLDKWLCCDYINKKQYDLLKEVLL